MEKGFRQILIKTGIFIALFIIFSLIIGQKIVASTLLYGFYIYIYGGLGKVFLFSIIGFIILYKEKLMKLKKYPYDGKDGWLVLMSFIFLSIFYIVELNIKNIPSTIANIILIQILFVSISATLFLGIFGLRFIFYFVKKFKKELSYFLIFGLILYSLMNFAWKLWPYFSLVVMKLTSFLLSLISDNVQVIGERTLVFEGFSAQIGEACSGIFSIFIFSGLYFFIVFLDWNKLDKLKAGIVFIPAILGAFLMNILRVFLLFIFGAYISKDLALGLYHSYVGMLFFMVYFAIFWIFGYKWMKIEKTRQDVIKKTYKKLMKDSLYRNSIYLMFSTFVMSVLGFIFWMIIVRLFSTEDVGLATTIISVMSLITGFSVLGLNIGLIRYLPQAKEKNKKINTSLTFVGLIAIIVSSIFLLGVDKFSPNLLFLKKNLIVAFSFIFFMVLASFNPIIDSIFTAYRDTKYILAKNTIFSALKLIFPLGFISLGAYGIFSSWMISLILAILFSLFILIRKFEYKPKFAFYESAIHKIGRYSFGNYIVGFIGGLPLMIIPLIITNAISPETTAYYYMTMMIATLLFAIPQASTQSLFAEGSYDEENLKTQIKKAIKIISFLMVPGILVIVLFGQYILLAFGKEYSIEGFRFLQILAISGFFISINKIYESILRVKKQIKKIAYVNICVVAIIFGLVYLLIKKGLPGIGVAWITGQIFASLLYMFLVGFRSKEQSKK